MGRSRSRPRGVPGPSRSRTWLTCGGALLLGCGGRTDVGWLQGGAQDGPVSVSGVGGAGPAPAVPVVPVESGGTAPAGPADPITVRREDLEGLTPHLEPVACGSGSVVFVKQSFTDPDLPENQDCIRDDVCLTRAGDAQLHNAALEEYTPSCSSTQPRGTFWASGTCADWNGDFSRFLPFGSIVCEPIYWLGRPLCLYLEDSGVFIDLTFLAAPSGPGNQGFAYVRTQVRCGTYAAECVVSDAGAECVCPPEYALDAQGQCALTSGGP